LIESAIYKKTGFRVQHCLPLRVFFLRAATPAAFGEEALPAVAEWNGTAGS